MNKRQNSSSFLIEEKEQDETSQSDQPWADHVTFTQHPSFILLFFWSLFQQKGGAYTFSCLYLTPSLCMTLSLLLFFSPSFLLSPCFSCSLSPPLYPFSPLSFSFPSFPLYLLLSFSQTFSRLTHFPFSLLSVLPLSTSLSLPPSIPHLSPSLPVTSSINLWTCPCFFWQSVSS